MAIVVVAKLLLCCDIICKHSIVHTCRQCCHCAIVVGVGFAVFLPGMFQVYNYGLITLAIIEGWAGSNKEQCRLGGLIILAGVVWS